MLPIEDALPALRQALADHSSAVLQAPPGAGKSTRVPLAMLDERWLGSQKIVMLEPRRLAARAVATRMAQTLGESVGTTVGFRTRLETRVSAETRIEVVTEGILTRWLQNDAALEGIGLVIFDEFHERSIHADLGLALCLDAQHTLREDLKLLVMSATLDGKAVASLLDEAPIVTSEGRNFPVDIRWSATDAAIRAQRSMRGEPRIEDQIASVIVRAIAEESGDVLAFLPGQGEIRRTQSLLESRDLPKSVRLFPLYGELGGDLQDDALQRSPPGHRKVVLATNIAETSLTIEGVRVVIDSGLARRAAFDPASGMSRLETVRISRASAEQRCGRAGRLEPGVCYRLWTQTEHAALAAQTLPEIAQADLAPLALELAGWGVRDPNTLRWLDSPPSAAFAQAVDLLKQLGAIAADGRITAHGREMTKLSAHPRLAHMILRSQDWGLQDIALIIAALLGERDLLRFSGTDRNVDLRVRLDVLQDSRSGPSTAQVDSGTRQRIKRTIDQLQRQLGANTKRIPSGDEEVGRLLALAYPDRIAQSRGSGGRYLLSNGRGAHLPPAQSLAQQEFLVIADLDAGDRDALIRLAAPISRSALEHDFSDAIEIRDRIEWDSREQAVAARREHWLGALRLEEARLQRTDPTALTQAVLVGIREMGLQCLPWTKESKYLQQRLLFARATHSREPNPWPDVSDATLAATTEQWLAPWLSNVTRREHLARLDMHAVLSSFVDWNLQQRLNTYAPTHFTVPSGSRIPIDYGSDSPTLAVRLQEMFGLHETPRIAEGQVPLTIALLSPAHRPVQITKDLASFWARGYSEVKKDLKGRYPKHYWPDDPLCASATARAKPRKTE
jgi:ATP-dependent helicase HrpB